MRKILKTSTFAFFVCLTIQSGLLSCTKTNTVTKTVHDTLTVIQKDTIIRKDTVVQKDTLYLRNDTVSTAILTANPWKVQEVRALSGNNNPLFYLRGGSSNNINFDNEYVVFNPDHTGTYVDNTLTPYSITWTLTNNSTLVWTWNLPTPVVVTWEHIYYGNTALHYDEYYVQSGINILTAEIRIPK